MAIGAYEHQACGDEKKNFKIRYYYAAEAPGLRRRDARTHRLRRVAFMSRPRPRAENGRNRIDNDREAVIDELRNGSMYDES